MSEAVTLQPIASKLIERIIAKRLEATGIKDSKARVISEALRNLADKELG